MGEALNPTVSVVVISFNHRPFIEECIGSILGQDHDLSWEVIVADDASTDGTSDWLNDAAKNNPTLHILPTDQNLGAQANFRRALSAASGEFIATLEGDDFWLCATKLADQVSHLRAHPEVPAVGGLTEARSGEVSEPYQGDFDGRTSLRPEDILGGAFPHLSTLVYRRSALDTTPAWFDGLLGADWLLCCLLTCSGNGTIDLIRTPLSVYRRNDQSTWTPVPYGRRRLDHLRQVRSLDANTSVMTKQQSRIRYQATLRSILSSAAQTKPRRVGVALVRDAFAVAPLQMIRVIPIWLVGRLRRSG